MIACALDFFRVNSILPGAKTAEINVNNYPT